MFTIWKPNGAIGPPKNHRLPIWRGRLSNSAGESIRAIRARAVYPVECLEGAILVKKMWSGLAFNLKGRQNRTAV